MMPGGYPAVPGLGHISRGFWHPGRAEGCPKCPSLWRQGEPVIAVEYGPDRRPKPGGLRFAATVVATPGPYVIVRYADPAETGRDTDQFYADRGWRAHDGELRWKLRKRGQGETLP
jgi:hypothetical protein